MSERFQDSLEKDPLLETQRILQEIDELLAKLNEQKDLDPEIQRALRAQIQALMAKLGANSYQEFVIFARNLQTEIYRRRREPNIPTNYPSLDKFKSNYSRLLSEKPYYLPGVRNKIEATEVAAYAQADWKNIEGRGLDIVTYTFKMGLVMSDELLYRDSFKEIDSITIGEGWQVENGRHRALTLRVLGRGYISHSGMDFWVAIQKDSDML